MDNEIRVIDTTTAKQCYIAVVMQDRAYGGCEEGGWWYDTEELLEQKQVHTREAREAVIAEYRSRYTNAGRKSISSVCSTGRFAIRISKKKVAPYYPTYRPHYE